MYHFQYEVCEEAKKLQNHTPWTDKNGFLNRSRRACVKMGG